MRQFLMLFVVMAAVGLGVARYADHSKSGGTNAMAMAARPEPTPAVSSNYRTVTLKGDNRGHFQTDVRIDGRSIAILVDTGASSIALRESSAAKLGIHPSVRDYNIKMQPPMASARRRGSRSTGSSSAASRCATSRRWWCPTNRCRRTCSA
jgi:aspartyl protease family protein